MTNEGCELTEKDVSTENALTYFILPLARQRRGVLRVYAVSNVRDYRPRKCEHAWRRPCSYLFQRKKHKAGEAPLYRVRAEEGRLVHEELSPGSPEFVKVLKWVGHGYTRSLLNHPGTAKTEGDITKLLIEGEQ